MANPWVALRGLFETEQVLMGSVSSHLPNGTSLITTPEGGTLIADGIDYAIGAKVTVKGRQIIGELPAGQLFTLEV